MKLKAINGDFIRKLHLIQQFSPFLSVKGVRRAFHPSDATVVQVILVIAKSNI